MEALPLGLVLCWGYEEQDSGFYWAFLSPSSPKGYKMLFVGGDLKFAVGHLKGTVCLRAQRILRRG